MHFALPEGEYVLVEVVEPGTAGLAYDCKIRLGFQCSGITAAREAWCDSSDVSGFLNELESLSSTLQGSATLNSDDGRAIRLYVAPVDTLGHFVLEASVVRGRHFGGKYFESSATGAFALSTQQVSDLCSAVGAHLKSCLGT